MAEPPPKKKKRSDIDGWGSKTTFNHIKKMKQHTTPRDWQRFSAIRLKYLVASVKWSRIVDDKVVTFVTPIAPGVKTFFLSCRASKTKTLRCFRL